MSKNVFFCVLGVFLGFVIGFFIANAVSRPSPLAPVENASSERAAGPLDPTQAGSALPPGHPEIENTGAPPSTAAATSSEAQSAMEKADRSANDFQAQMAAANTFYKLADYAKASLYGERALSLKPRDFSALVLVGNSKYDAGDFVAAEKFYRRALDVNANAPNVRTDLGSTFFRRTPPDYDRAIAEYRKSIAIDPNHVFTWQNLAAAALKKKDKAVASEAIERLATLEPNNRELPSLRQAAAELSP